MLVREGHHVDRISTIVVAAYVTGAGAYLAMPGAVFQPVIPVIVPAFVALFLAHTSRLHLPLGRKPEHILFWGYVALSFLVLATAGALDFYATRKILLPVLSLSLAVLLSGCRVDISRGTTAAAIVLGITVGGLITGQGAGGLGRGFIQSNWRSESVYGVLLGLLFLVHLANRRWAYAILSAIFCVYFAKRNAMSAAAIIGILYLFISKLSNARNSRRCLTLLSLVFLPIFALLSWNLDHVFNALAQRMSGVTAEFVSTGRYALYVLVKESILQSSLRELVFGNGPGSVERLIEATYYINPNITLAHSEYLALLHDYGLLGVISFFLVIIWAGARSVEAALVALYLIVIGVLENYLLIPVIMMPIAVLLFVDVGNRYEDPSCAQSISTKRWGGRRL